MQPKSLTRYPPERIQKMRSGGYYTKKCKLHRESPAIQPHSGRLPTENIYYNNEALETILFSGAIFYVKVVTMIERLSNGRHLNGNIKFHNTEEQINQILLSLYQQLGESGHNLLEQLSEAYARQYDVVFAEGFYSAAELIADLLRIRYSRSETDE